MTAGSPALVLASASPRRLELLRQIGVVPAAVDPADLDERPRPRELPAVHARRLAREKAEIVAARHPGAYVLAADTVVACGRRILPKAGNAEDARACLKMLSGRRHLVLGGVCVVAPDGRRGARLVRTAVTMKRFSPAEIEAYLASEEWLGKAGGYAVQGRAGAFVRFLSGSYSNVVGLALFETLSVLVGLGWKSP